MIVAAFVIGVVLAVVAFYEIKRLRLSARFSHIPSVKEVPIFGTTFFFRTFEMKYFMRYIEEMVFAPLCKIFIGPLLVLIVSDPEVLQEVLQSPAFSERPFFMRFFPYDTGLLSATHEVWKPIRRAANPAFSQRIVNSLIPIMNKHNVKFYKELESRVGGEAFDINRVIVNITLQQIMDTTFKYTSIHGQLDPSWLEEMVLLGLDRARTPILYPEFVWKFTASKRRIDEIARSIDAVLVPWVKEQLEREEDTATFVDLMAKYTKNGNKFGFKEIYDNVITLLVTGYETSSLTMAYVILMLAMHPEVDAKVAAELRDHWTENTEPDHELLKRLTYLDMVFKETLRLFATAPFIPREAMYDVNIKGLGLVPKGTIVGQVFFKLHRWKQIWGPGAETFDPDHFLPEAVAQRHPISFIPFGHGPRACIGAIYSQTNIKLGLIHILRKYRFTTDLKLHELDFKFVVSLKLNQLHMVRVHHRE